MQLLIGNDDYSDHVIAGSYQVNNEPMYSNLTDANYTVHRRKLRDKIVGTFDMFFRTVEDYEDFLDSLTAAKQSADDSIEITLDVNNTLEVGKTIYAFVRYSLVRDRDGKWDDYFQRYTVSIEER